MVHLHVLRFPALTPIAIPRLGWKARADSQDAVLATPQACWTMTNLRRQSKNRKAFRLER